MDANVTTLIAAIVLFQFGTGPIKGFAVTLSLGIGIAVIPQEIGKDYFTVAKPAQLRLDEVITDGSAYLTDGVAVQIADPANWAMLRKTKKDVEGQ